MPSAEKSGFGEEGCARIRWARATSRYELVATCGAKNQLVDELGTDVRDRRRENSRDD